MADDKTKIQGNFQQYLTEQHESSKDQNTDLPNGDNIRFMQFCRLMGLKEEDGGFGLEVFNKIADQAGAIMVSRERLGRTEAKEALIGMDKKEMERRMYGPVFRPDEEPDAKKGRR